MNEDIHIVYFSSVSNYTHRFVEKLGYSSDRLPLRTKEETIVMDTPYVLILPTYAGGNGKGAVPKQVVKFLNVPRNRELIRAVVATGNTNFGEQYCIAGDIVAAKVDVPLLYRLELFGTPEDVEETRKRMEAFWKTL